MNLASEDPTIDSGLKAVSLLERHSLLACNIIPAASLEGSILLCNDYSSHLPPARSHVNEIELLQDFSRTQPQQVIDFEELLSELITKAKMLRHHLGSRLVSALLTYEDRCGRKLVTQ